jgi:alkylated DNA repair dioxygenase AlkB
LFLALYSSCANSKQYHDDGEKTLGPTVATLSLGANATMNFRPKKKTHIPSFEGGNISVRGRGKSTLSKFGSKDKKDKSSVLSINLEHGDIVIMHGREIQQLFEVCSPFCLVVYQF